MFFDVYLDGRFYDTVYLPNRMTNAAAKKKLIEDGYHPNINVKISLT